MWSSGESNRVGDDLYRVRDKLEEAAEELVLAAAAAANSAGSLRDADEIDPFQMNSTALLINRAISRAGDLCSEATRYLPE